MRAGLLNKRVTFEVLTRIADGAGGWTEDWGDALTMWGQFSPERGRERIQAGRVDSTLAGVLRIRSSIAARVLTTHHRVTIDGNVYNIRSVSNPDQHNDMLELTIES